LLDDRAAWTICREGRKGFGLTIEVAAVAIDPVFRGFHGASGPIGNVLESTTAAPHEPSPNQQTRSSRLRVFAALAIK
jgi:hypothetical protein